jgi:hypothetical protein
VYRRREAAAGAAITLIRRPSPTQLSDLITLIRRTGPKLPIDRDNIYLTLIITL